MPLVSGCTHKIKQGVGVLVAEADTSAAALLLGNPCFLTDGELPGHCLSLCFRPSAMPPKVRGVSTCWPGVPSFQRLALFRPLVEALSSRYVAQASAGALPEHTNTCQHDRHGKHNGVLERILPSDDTEGQSVRES